jgi:hypothetical protein
VKRDIDRHVGVVRIVYVLRDPDAHVIQAAGVVVIRVRAFLDEQETVGGERTGAAVCGGIAQEREMSGFPCAFAHVGELGFAFEEPDEEPVRDEAHDADREQDVDKCEFHNLIFGVSISD